MIDYRQPEYRRELFTNLYAFNLENRIMPGLVYLYMPELKKSLQWDDESALWFAFLNGMTQNPITSLRMFRELDHVPVSKAELSTFSDWFNSSWDTLQFDTDRRYGKKETVKAIASYARLVSEHGGFQSMLWALGTSYTELWSRASSIYSFGRLSCFSYLEYVKIMGFGADCDDLMFEDKSGSKSHRNGMLMLLGMDHLVNDKRAVKPHDGNYPDFNKMCSYLHKEADQYLYDFQQNLPHPDASRFTLESNLCTFKNMFFGRRYPGVYADMAWDRIVWAEDKGQHEHTAPFRAIREQLPISLRAECDTKPMRLVDKAKLFPETGHLLRLQEWMNS